MTEYIVYFLAFSNVAILGWLIFLHNKYRNVYKKSEILFSEESGVSVAKVIENYLKNVKDVETHCFNLDQKMKELEKTIDLSLYRKGFVRYNPFGDVGGNQSFSLCLLNGKKDGFVISSIHSREGTRVYSKTVTGGEGDYNLSEEEKQSLELALKK